MNFFILRMVINVSKGGLPGHGGEAAPGEDRQGGTAGGEECGGVPL